MSRPFAHEQRESLLIERGFCISLDDLPKPTLAQDLAALLVESECRLVDVRLHRVESSSVPKDAHDVSLEGLRMHQVLSGGSDVLLDRVEANWALDYVQVLAVVNLLPKRLDEVLSFVFVDHNAEHLIEEVASADLAAAWTRVDQGRVLQRRKDCLALALAGQLRVVFRTNKFLTSALVH